MKTFKDLEFTNLSDLFVGIQSRISFDNGYGASVVRSQYSDGGEKGLYEIAVLDIDGQKCNTTPVTDDVIGYLRDIDVTDVMVKIQQLPSVKTSPTKKSLKEKLLFNLKWIIDYYFIYFLYNDRKIKAYHHYMTRKYGNKYTDLFTNRDGESQ
jgi:hypothetical protein